MYDKSMKNYHLVRMFTDGLLDKRMNAYKNLKAADSLCRKSIEKLLSENAAIKKSISHDNEQWAWIKELIVNSLIGKPLV